ncbi:hypothetical protein ABWU93_11525 [Xanthomonas translucens pv. translucens]|uniref:hypothetical protein n=1 Tax=Xanthomonas campestris pv. translucens TaxID=343 RepID=UPI003F71C237
MSSFSSSRPASSDEVLLLCVCAARLIQNQLHVRQFLYGHENIIGRLFYIAKSRFEILKSVEWVVLIKFDLGCCVQEIVEPIKSCLKIGHSDGDQLESIGKNYKRNAPFIRSKSASCKALDLPRVIAVGMCGITLSLTVRACP